MSDQPSPEEDAILTDLAHRAGRIATRLLETRHVAYLDDLAPQDTRDVLRAAWHAAAAERFAGEDIAELHQEIDAMIDSMVMDLRQPRHQGLLRH